MTSRPRVYARIRPQNLNEEAQGGTVCLSCDKKNSPHNDVLLFEKDGAPVKTRFDRIFDVDDGQREVYEHIGKEVLNTLFSGYNASIFAYGQTGSGKSYTMEGPAEMDLLGNDDLCGLIPRLMGAIFEMFHIKEVKESVTGWSVMCSYVQVYQEHIQDLFNNKKQLEIHFDKSGQYVATGATWHTVNSAFEALKIYRHALKNRCTGSTDMNLVSSRSHAILMLKLTWDEPNLPGTSAQLNLIDLAGSEKLKQSNASGVTMQETIYINRSLSSLASVVMKLAEQAKHKNKRVHIPYKDSKLTYLLQPSLGGTNPIHFILALSSSTCWRNESHSTIEFGKRALQLIIRPVRNPIDYKRLEEMEATIERMRNHIRNLEEELQNKPQMISVAEGEVGMRGVGVGGDFPEGNFLMLKRLDQDEVRAIDQKSKEKKKQKRSERKVGNQLKEMKRIMANLPETLDDLDSHCALVHNSKASFRELDGIPMLIGFVKDCLSTFHRAHAAHSIASVIDDKGRAIVGDCDGIEALYNLTLINDEQCKMGGCVGLDAVVRSCNKNKAKLTMPMYKQLVSLFYESKNQQVQEAACSCLATITDNYPACKPILLSLNFIQKLLDTLRHALAELSHVVQCVTTCLGRLAQGDVAMQRVIAENDGISILIDKVLFSDVGERDYQVPVLASYALVNLCCNNASNMAIVNSHPRADEVRYKLMTGLARAFGLNSATEGFGRATAEENAGPFPYYGITVMGAWDNFTNGGMPQSTNFLDNPQYYLYVYEDIKVTFVLQDTLYEKRAALKQKNNTSFMGIAVYESDPDLVSLGMKQIDFRGSRMAISRFTSNRENVVNCVLKKSSKPYIVIPFITEKSRVTKFSFSAFAEAPVDFMPLIETTEWNHHEVNGSWTDFTGTAGNNFEWRCNPQIHVKSLTARRVYFVLGYDPATCQDPNRPSLYGRVFKHPFASHMRYIKAFAPLPTESTFVSINAYNSNTYVVTQAKLEENVTYAYIPYTETPYKGKWRLRILTDSDALKVCPVTNLDQEWHITSVAGKWAGMNALVSFQSKGNLCSFVHSEDTFVKLNLVTVSEKLGMLKIAGGVAGKYWSTESNAEFKGGNEISTFRLIADGIVKNENDTQAVAHGNPFIFYIFSDLAPIVILTTDGLTDTIVTECPPQLPSSQTSRQLLQCPVVSTMDASDSDPNTNTVNGRMTDDAGSPDNDASSLNGGAGSNSDTDSDDSLSLYGADETEIRERIDIAMAALREENARLKREIADKDSTAETLQQGETLGGMRGIGSVGGGNVGSITTTDLNASCDSVTCDITTSCCSSEPNIVNQKKQPLQPHRNDNYNKSSKENRLSSPHHGLTSPALGPLSQSGRQQSIFKVNKDALRAQKMNEHQATIENVVTRLETLMRALEKPKNEIEWRKLKDDIKICHTKLKKVKVVGSGV